VLGLLADNNITSQVEALVGVMRSEAWADFWFALGLTFKHFDDVGLSSSSSDEQIWQTCQAEELVLITNNRNDDASDSLEATIRHYNQPNSLPVFTIADLNKLHASRSYAERVVESLYDYLMRIDEVRGTGRLYLPYPR